MRFMKLVDGYRIGLLLLACALVGFACPSQSQAASFQGLGDLRKTVLSGQYGHMPVAELLDLALKTHDPSRVEMRLSLLLRKDESLPLLKQQLRTSQDDNQRYDLLMLIQGQLRWAESTPEILALLNNADCSDRVRGRAATAAALFQVKQAVPAIRKLLENARDPQARQWAAMALGLLRDMESHERVESLLQDPSPYVRLTGAMVLGQLGSDAGRDVVIGLSDSEKFDIRCRAAEALSYIGSDAALARLREMEKSDPSLTVRSESSEYLGRAELEALDKDIALAKLKELLAPEKDNPPKWAFVYLAEHFGSDAVHFLQQLADSPGPLQGAAAVALLELSADVVMIPYARRRQP